MKPSKYLFLVIAIFLLGNTTINAQTSKYYPKGDPNKWNVELTPFLWLPAISGEVGSERLSEDYDIPAVDLLSNLKMAFMFTAEVSKGKFFMAPTYFYSKLGSEEYIWTSEGGEENIAVIPELKMNIFSVGHAL